MPTLLLLGAMLTPWLSAQSAGIRGVVVNSVTGKPIPGAEVSAYPSKTVTGDDGAFSFSSLPPGLYYLQAQAPRFIPRSGAYPYTLAAGQQISDVKIALFPPAAIQGKVVDTEGRPVRDAMVTELHRLHGQEADHRPRSATTNAAGDFRLEDVAPGNTRLVVASHPMLRMARPGPKELNFRPTFFPSVTSLQDAQLIPVAPGSSLQGIRITVRRQAPVRVKGRITPPSSPPQSRLLVAAMYPREPGGASTFDLLAGVPVAADGSFELTDVLPGEVELVLGTGPQLADGYGMGIKGRVKITVPQTGLANAILPVTRPEVTVSGKVVVEGTAPAALSSHTSVRFFPKNEASSPSEHFTTNANAQGEFTIALPRGRYTVNIYPEPKDSRLYQLVVNDRSSPPPTLDVSSGPTARFLVVKFKQGLCNLRGKITTDGSTPAVHVRVYTVSDSGPAPATSTDQNGDFLIPEMLPGNCRIYSSASTTVELTEEVVREKGIAHTHTCPSQHPPIVRQVSQ